VPEPRQAQLSTLRDASGAPLDQALVLWFPGPQSETGEDVAELQLHGGRAVIAAVLRSLGELPGFRLAEPGEFTRRAFENGRLDLAAVEGLADLIGAETEAQRRQAFAQAAGILGRTADRWRSKLVEALARVEAALDFSDEGDVPADVVEGARAAAAELETEIRVALVGAGRAERLREGLVVAIAGPPNAGKSTLLNWIAGRDVAIVSAHAGTTRDVLEVHLDLGGYPITLLDTAGVRPTEDPVEQEGVRRAQERSASADLVLWIEEASRLLAVPPDISHLTGTTVWIVAGKADLLPTCGTSKLPPAVRADYTVSAHTGAGIPELLEGLSRYAQETFGAGEPALVTRARHRQALEDASAALDRARQLGPGAEDLVAEELRLAARALERLVGRIGVDDVLDQLFSSFCIGK
jgi:tRNA modification GTPase